MAKAIRLIKALLRPLLKPNLHRPQISVPYHFHGTDYGGWPVIDGTLDSNSVIYSFGVGEDISFDLSVVEHFGCTLHAFDPTPKATAWIAAQSLPASMSFSAFGIAGADGDVHFFPPANPNDTSFSVAPGAKTTGSPFIAKAYRLGNIMKMLGDQRLDVLKMDVEGFEYDIIKDIIAQSIFPAQLLIEFHHGMYSIDCDATREAVQRLMSVGYKIYYVSEIGHEYGFFLPDSIRPAAV